jgi:catechol 2,3-dioxygenase-like lactoylglutathione lyase family enzyme
VRVHHIGLWAADLERLRAFYVDVLGGVSGPRYENPRTGFRSYFVSFGEGARLELMARADRTAPLPEGARGLAHVALALGSREAVDEAVARLRSLGVPVVGEPRTTGDGYYEAVIDDPEGNLIELVA